MKILLLAEMEKNLVQKMMTTMQVETGGWYESNTLLSEDEIIHLMKGKEILITSYDEITRKVINECEDLKLIACTRSNPVNIDYKAARGRGVPIIYTPGRNADSAAEYTIAMMLNIARSIPFAYRDLKEGRYLGANQPSTSNKEGLKEDVTWALGEGSPYIHFKGFELRNKVLGIIGFGQIGKKVAKLAEAFGMKIVVLDPFTKEMPNESYKSVNLETLLKKSDFITSHASVVKETKGMLNKEAFQKMKKSAFLINTSRGAIINEEDLIEALRNKDIAGAALDVFANEPLSVDHPFVTELDNVIITPHIAGATYDAIRIHTEMILEDIERFIAGEPLNYEYTE